MLLYGIHCRGTVLPEPCDSQLPSLNLRLDSVVSVCAPFLVPARYSSRSRHRRRHAVLSPHRLPASRAHTCRPVVASSGGPQTLLPITLHVSIQTTLWHTLQTQLLEPPLTPTIVRPPSCSSTCQPTPASKALGPHLPRTQGTAVPPPSPPSPHSPLSPAALLQCRLLSQGPFPLAWTSVHCSPHKPSSIHSPLPSDSALLLKCPWNIVLVPQS